MDSVQCRECDARNNVTLGALDVRIGDFGLVAFADSEDKKITASDIVGTEVYRPATANVHGPSLDIYALGIVAFELLNKFDTRMERLHSINQLKQGAFPEGT